MKNAVKACFTLSALFLSCQQALATGVHLGVEHITVFGSEDGFKHSGHSLSQGIVGQQELSMRPISRTAEILEFIPGMIATQHSGEGKANQYFLRGFNLDHGSDFNLNVDGMPANMPTHGHGQGYMDMNFIIPEMVQSLSFRKGNYYADVGDFSVAGSADMKYLDTLSNTLVKAELGSDNYQRYLLADAYRHQMHEVIFAAEQYFYDGPFELKQDVDKTNLLAKYVYHTDDLYVAVTAMAYDNTWLAPDQIPARAVESGQISEYGFVDPNVGGESSRKSLSVASSFEYENNLIDISAYVIDYELELFSNFSYFAGYPVKGDQIEQYDDRQVYGSKVMISGHNEGFVLPYNYKFGLQTRSDKIDKVALYQTDKRQRFNTLAEHNVWQNSTGLFADFDFQLNDIVRTVIGARYQTQRFDADNLQTDAANIEDKDSAFLPKFSLILGPFDDIEYYLNIGRGFHSNDIRSVSNSHLEPITLATSYDVGVRYHPSKQIQLAASVFRIDLDSELVFVGDEGTTEASSPSERYGVELSAHYRPTNDVLIDFDYSSTNARLDVEGNEDHIPNAVGDVASLGINYKWSDDLNGGIRARYLGAAPLIEDNSVKSDASFSVNAQMNYRLAKNWSLQFSIMNLLDSDDNDITYFYESQLANESQPVADIHFHRLEPRTFRLGITGRFAN